MCFFFISFSKKYIFILVSWPSFLVSLFLLFFFRTNNDDSCAHVIFPPILFLSWCVWNCLISVRGSDKHRVPGKMCESSLPPVLIQTQLQRKRRSTCGCMKGNAEPRVKRQHTSENITSLHLIPHSPSEKNFFQKKKAVICKLLRTMHPLYIVLVFYSFHRITEINRLAYHNIFFLCRLKIYSILAKAWFLVRLFILQILINRV